MAWFGETRKRWCQRLCWDFGITHPLAPFLRLFAILKQPRQEHHGHSSFFTWLLVDKMRVLLTENQRKGVRRTGGSEAHR